MPFKKETLFAKPSFFDLGLLAGGSMTEEVVGRKMIIALLGKLNLRCLTLTHSGDSSQLLDM